MKKHCVDNLLTHNLLDQPILLKSVAVVTVCDQIQKFMNETMSETMKFRVNLSILNETDTVIMLRSTVKTKIIPARGRVS